MGITSRMIPTEDASARKREIEEKLKQEQETLSFIRENLEKSDQLTKGMVRRSVCTAVQNKTFSFLFS
ncbi:Exocyst complex component 7 [Xenotaenia resolanae]|uniref:Exocyst complex component 7 n=1 Tax=Xenotaenia resolanae TaxID=208358 RepID=A0ABV0WYL7_9TELE